MVSSQATLRPLSVAIPGFPLGLDMTVDNSSWLTTPRSAPDDRPLPQPKSRRGQRPTSNHSDLISKINLLDLATEITAIIFRQAHKPPDLHYLVPSGAGPLIPRKYNLPLVVSKEWYRRVRPIYYETLRLTWLRMSDFIEHVQRYELGVYVRRIHISIVGKNFYKVIKSHGDEPPRLSSAQLCMLISQYLDAPLATFALCLDSLACLKDLTLSFSDCRGGEISLQSIPIQCR
jgi:hypothetical protein